jgi:dethiobiotin synthetase
VKPPIFFITGTDTGVGKTVLACLLTRYLATGGIAVAGLKPLCSGGRDDARLLRAAAGNTLTLDEVNPWHFRASLSPLLAARREKRKVTLARVTAHVRRIQKRFSTVVIEGAGGLLSPLGEDFDSRDLIETFDATPLVVCPNRLGAINQVRLVIAALPRAAAANAQIVLTSRRRPDAASRGNVQYLREIFGRDRVHVLPWLKSPTRYELALADRQVRQTIKSLGRNLYRQGARKFFPASVQASLLR